MDLTNNKKFNLVEILPFIFIVLFLGLLFVVLMKYPFLSVDEGFTRGFLNLSFADMVGLTALDVHPPLYYFFPMAFVKICHAVGLNLNITQLMKVPSIFPYLILLAFSLTKLRKEYGLVMAGIFSLALIALSDFFMQYLTARMYTWALLFLIISFFYVKDILEKNDLKSWILFTVFSVLGAYTHYFTGLSSIIIYMMLFVWILINRKDGSFIDRLKNFFISVVVGFVLYLPWIFILFEQMKVVHDNYWVEPITAHNIISFCSYCFTFSNNQFIILMSFTLLVAIIVLFLKKYLETMDNDDLYMVMGVGVFVGTLVVGFIMSVVYKPILISRYLLPSIGVLWLCLSIKLSGMNLKNSAILMIILLIAVVGAFNVYHEIQDIQKMNDYTIEEAKVLESINNNDSIIVYDTFNHYLRTHLDLDKVYQGYAGYSMNNATVTIPYELDIVNEPFVIPDDLSKYPDKKVYFMVFYKSKADFPDDIQAEKIGSAQHATFYEIKSV
ncbi:hypothetical protein [Methanobrevibacter sp.]|uniref:glycosyltransferase family 39 protein n=1 Tax=Methanobrevibacter sp. TaxID=66852 RepID=UPI003866F7E6